MTEFMRDLDLDQISVFDDIEAAMTEPIIEKALQEARALNEMLRETTPTEEELVQLIEHLDKIWGNFANQKMKVTGEITAYNNFATRYDGVIVDISDDEGESTIQQQYEQEMKSCGFIAEENALGQYTIKLLGERQLGVAEDGIPGDSQYIGIDIDKARVDFMYILSKERAQKWLEVYAPDLIAEVDSILFSEGVNSSADAIAAVGNIDLSGLDECAWQEEQAAQCLQIYLEGIVNIDKSVPYQMGLDGYVLVDRDPTQAGTYITKQPNALMTVRTITPGTITIDGNVERRLFLDTILHTQESGEIHQYVCADAVTYCVSIRDIAY